MMTGGRIVMHAEHYLSDSKNRLYFVGYQGEETLGREILEGASTVMIGDKKVAVNAQIGRTDGMSAHADQKQLLDWLSKIKHVKKVILTHGENDARGELAQKIQSELGNQDIILPYFYQEIKLYN